MNALQAIILGNIVVIFFNLIGMSCGMNAPPIWAYVIGWPVVIVAIYVISNAHA